MIWATCVVENVSTYQDILTLDFLSNFGASTILTWVLADTASAACPSQSSSLACYDIHHFRGRHLGCRRTLLCEHCIRSWIIYCTVTSEHDPAFVLLILRLQLCIFEMTDVHQSSNMESYFLFGVLPEWPPFCSLLWSIASLATFRASPFLGPLLLSHLDFFIAWSIATNWGTKL